MVLEAAYQAVEDAGYLTENLQLRAECRQTTGVVVATCLANELSSDLHLKYYYPEIRYYLDQIDAFRELASEDQKRLLASLKQGLAAGHGYQPVHGAVLNIEALADCPPYGHHEVSTTCRCRLRHIVCGHGLCDQGVAVRFTRHADRGRRQYQSVPGIVRGFSKMGTLSASGSFPF